MKNWKTTLAGVLGAAALVIFQLISQGNVDVKTLIIAGAVAAMGAFAKDHDVTGGTIVQASLPLANALVSQLATTNDSPILKDIHSVLSTIAVNTATPPATAPAAAPVIINDVKAD